MGTLLDRNDASFFSTLTPDTGRLRKLHPTSGHGRDARQHTISCRQDQIPYTTLIEQRISRLLAETSLPWRAIHVAGTNGKGSICAYVSSMLETYNKSDWRRSTCLRALKHARFTSPHLVDRWDCITLDQQVVPFKLFSRIEQAVLQRNDQEAIRASEFELLTATAFEVFTHEDVDVAVVEVGLGGRLDATNVIGQASNSSSQLGIAEANAFRPPPLVTAISKIGLDHQALLGNTLREIASQKAGIMKPGVPVVYDLSNADEVKTELHARANLNRVVTWADAELPTRFLDPDLKHAFFADELATAPTIPDPTSRTPDHIRSNMSVAFRAAWTALQRLNRVPSDYDHLQPNELTTLGDLAPSMIRNASQHARVPGRLQPLSIEALTGRTQDILLDGAHNAQSAEVLAAQVDKLRASHQQQASHSGVTWVLACSSTKDVSEMLRILLRPGDKVFAVEFGSVDGMPWVEPLGSEKIVEAVESVPAIAGQVEAVACGRDVTSAMRRASNAAEGGPMVVAGSLYLVGDVLRLLRDGIART
ncbi:folylpolyglutamate synthase [Friedmanniomyces endolithicus]|nr:folylpolyglutamate synthase [Friedmanniomyces endolithicus]KAK0787354.1 folylpolyglutamate synthase [Friedmanniomyces endolithicus]KAK0792333.1 folylpolyglutamate synthase [Friedmanniomyces endolithicus]KAK0814367.1 folylpolyglutamate synthase [Friedmanniomyces endolithicus]KAK0836225.1 folylpolyglutamate synthase [Friedmanniomyces endolithicus]